MKPPTESEKQSCLCIRCFSMHCLLRGINIYRILKKLNTFASATAYLECECSKETNSEIDDVKEISYFVFEKKEKCYVKNGKEMVSCRKH